jgi:UDP-N-acetylglucosamine:LPS N-acetylglucosamine transferase
MVTKPRILLAMITVGNGHKAPAEAIKAGIEKLYPNRFELEVLDFTAEVGDIEFDKKHKNSWDWMLAYPKFAYWGQVLLDALVPVKAVRFAQGKLLAHHAKNAAKYIKHKNYDLIVATHFFSIQAIAIAKKKYGIHTPLIGINTDPFDAHSMWAEPGVDLMIVASQVAKQRLVKKLVPAEKISIFGYPLGLQFLENHASRQEAHTTLGLDSTLLTILQSAGGEGIGGQLEEFVQAVLRANLPIQYVIACGRNSGLALHLTKLAEHHPKTRTKVVVQGYIHNMQTWLAASDLVLGKAGASTTFEALAMNRPIFHTSYVAYNEKTNVDWCIEQGLGRYIATPNQLIEVLQDFLANPDHLVQLQQKVEQLSVEAGTLEIARHLVETYLS